MSLDQPHSLLIAFIRESNFIEGMDRDPTDEEICAAHAFLQLTLMSPRCLCNLQEVFAPGKLLRDTSKMNVRVGSYIAPPGGTAIFEELRQLCRNANDGHDPWKVHVAFEMLHPFMDGNGRTGRMLWAWMMINQDKPAFSLSFLHRFYYQTLKAQGEINKQDKCDNISTNTENYIFPH